MFGLFFKWQITNNQLKNTSEEKLSQLLSLCNRLCQSITRSINIPQIVWRAHFENVQPNSECRKPHMFICRCYRFLLPVFCYQCSATRCALLIVVFFSFIVTLTWWKGGCCRLPHAKQIHAQAFAKSPPNNTLQ